MCVCVCVWVGVERLDKHMISAKFLRVARGSLNILCVRMYEWYRLNEV